MVSQRPEWPLPKLSMNLANGTHLLDVIRNNAPLGYTDHHMVCLLQNVKGKHGRVRGVTEEETSLILQSSRGEGRPSHWKQPLSLMASTLVFLNTWSWPFRNVH